MKRIYFLFILSFLIGSLTTIASAQCCPDRQKVGQRDEFLYEYDNIQIDTYSCGAHGDDDWVTILSNGDMWVENDEATCLLVLQIPTIIFNCVGG